MSPTLREGDLLEIAPFGGGTPRTGDVVVFRPKGAEHRVAHRVVGATRSGYRTAGDNNEAVDPGVLGLHRISGRVEAAWRGGRRRAIRGGRRGALLGQTTRAARRLLRRARSLLAPGRRPAAPRTHRGRPLWVRLGWRVVAYRGPSGTRLQLLAGRTVIGAYEPRRASWTVRWPYRLLVDGGTLLGGHGNRECPSSRADGGGEQEGVVRDRAGAGSEGT